MTCVVQPCPTLSNLLPRLDSKNIIYFNQLQHPSNLVQPFRARAYARNLLEWRLRLNVFSDFFLVNLLKRLDKVGRLDSGMILNEKNPSNLLKGWTRLDGLQNLPKILWGYMQISARDQKVLSILRCTYHPLAVREISRKISQRHAIRNTATIRASLSRLRSLGLVRQLSRPGDVGFWTISAKGELGYE